MAASTSHMHKLTCDVSDCSRTNKKNAHQYKVFSDAAKLWLHAMTKNRHGWVRFFCCCRKQLAHNTKLMLEQNRVYFLKRRALNSYLGK